MYELNELIMAAIACFILGGIAGLIYTNNTHQGSRKSKELEKQLADSQAELQAYKQQVNDHFHKTAELVRGMNDSYRDVHQHLAQGAQNLAKMSATSAFSLLEQSSSDNDHDEDQGFVQAPLDYSPKKSPYDKGMLQEDFGLEKVSNLDSSDEEETFQPHSTMAEKL